MLALQTAVIGGIGKNPGQDMFSALVTVFGAGATTSTTAARFSMTLSATKHHHLPCHCMV